MAGEITGLLSQFGSLAHPIGWGVVALFLVGFALEYVDDRYARWAYVAGWTLFAVFWLALIYPWFAHDNSFVRGIGAVAAVPLSLLVAKTLHEGRESLFTLSRAILFMGLVYAPVMFIEPLREFLVLTVTHHTAWAMGLIGFDPPIVTELSEVGVERTISGKETTFENTFVFFLDGGGTITYTILIACTGLGSMAVVIGLVAAVGAPLRRKLRALAIALPIIYVLNIVRNVFIAINYGHQKMHFAPDLTMMLFGLDTSLRVSYIWADRVMAQLASVVAMVLIFWLVIREVPEVMDPVEEVLFLLTGNEYDLAAAFNLDTASDAGDVEPAD